MGGIGSGRYRRTGTKTAVEDCLRLDIRALRRQKALRPGHSSTLTWTQPGMRFPRASMGFRVLTTEAGGIQIELSSRYGDQMDVTQIIPVATSPHPNRGEFYWFLCPLSQGDQICGRRARTLFAKGPHFGCRQCQDLRYRSSQDAHKVERLMRQLGP